MSIVKNKSNHEDTSVDTVIVAAGSGSRLGASVPKAFVPLNGKPMLAYSLSTFLDHESINNVILVVPEFLVPDSITLFQHISVKVVAGGSERWQSVSNGLNSSTADWVLVHDAARPFVSRKVIDDVLLLRSEFECGITVTPEVDTIRTFEGNRAKDTVDRSKLVRVGTPQLFKRDLLMKYISSVSTLPQIPTDEAMLFQAHGQDIGISWGDPKNFKITTPEDLEIAEALIGKKTM